MTDHPRRLTILLALPLAIWACAAPGGGATQPTPPPSVPSVAPPSSDTAAPTTADAGETAPTVALTQPWATAQLTDVTTGESFSIAELVAQDKVVFLETMAVWCTNCRIQQGDAVKALDRLDRSMVSWIALDIEPSETPEMVAAYREQHGFELTYAIAPPDVARALVAEFGDQVLSPPSTPIVVIGNDGRVTLTRFGHKSVDDLLALAGEHGA